MFELFCNNSLTAPSETCVIILYPPGLLKSKNVYRVSLFLAKVPSYRDQKKHSPVRYCLDNSNFLVSVFRR